MFPRMLVGLVLLSMIAPSGGVDAAAFTLIKRHVMYYEGDMSLSSNGEDPKYAKASNDTRVLKVPAGTEKVVILAYGAGSPGSRWKTASGIFGGHKSHSRDGRDGQHVEAAYTISAGDSVSVRLGRGGLVNAGASEGSLSPFHPYGEDTVVSGPGFKVTAKGADFRYEEHATRLSSPGNNGATGEFLYSIEKFSRAYGPGWIVEGVPSHGRYADGVGDSAYIVKGKVAQLLVPTVKTWCFHGPGACTHDQTGTKPLNVLSDEAKRVTYDSPVGLAIRRGDIKSPSGVKIEQSGKYLVYEEKNYEQVCVKRYKVKCMEYQTRMTGVTNHPVYEFNDFYLDDPSYGLFKSSAKVAMGAKAGASWFGGPGGAIVEFWGKRIPDTCDNGATDYPACELIGDACDNGATNYPQCTTTEGDGCLNGATNPPACTIAAACDNGATNPPACTIGANGTSTDADDGRGNNGNGDGGDGNGGDSLLAGLSLVSDKNIRVRSLGSGSATSQPVSVFAMRTNFSGPVALSVVGSNVPAEADISYSLNGLDFTATPSPVSILDREPLTLKIKISGKLPNACGETVAPSCTNYVVNLKGIDLGALGLDVSTSLRIIQESIIPSYGEI